MTPASPPSRRDRSMDLLRIVTETALEPGYRSLPQPPTTPLRRAGMVLTMVVMGVLLGTMMSAVWRARPQALAERDQLVARVTQAQQRAQNLRTQAQNLRTEVGDLQNQALHGDRDLTARTERAQVLADEVPVNGPGLTIVVDDAQLDGPAPEGGRLLDTDLRKVVNGLRQAGAEAIAINGHRLTAQTSIRHAGSAITVGYRSLTPPYRIQAIGEATTLPGRFAQTAGGAWLTSVQHTYGVRVEITTSSSISLPAATTPALRAARKK